MRPKAETKPAVGDRVVWLCWVVLGRECWLVRLGRAMPPADVSGADLAGALRAGVRESKASANPPVT